MLHRWNSNEVFGKSRIMLEISYLLLHGKPRTHAIRFRSSRSLERERRVFHFTCWTNSWCGRWLLRGGKLFAHVRSLLLVIYLVFPHSSCLKRHSKNPHWNINHQCCSLGSTLPLKIYIYKPVIAFKLLRTVIIPHNAHQRNMADGCQLIVLLWRFM